MVFTLHVSHCLNISKQMRSTKTLAPLFTFSSIEFTTKHSSAFLRGRSNFFDWSTASRRGVGCTLTPRHSLRAQSLTMMTELQSCLTDCETDPSPAMKKHLFNLSHLLDYFSQIERCLETSSSPAMEFRHCYAYGGRDSKTFFKSAGSTMAKPMMRTLIYGGLPMEGNFVKNDSNDTNPKCSLTTKTQFDQLIRDVRSSIEFQRMHHFIVEELQPAVLSMDEEDRVNLIPDALKRIEEIARYLSPSVCNADDATEGILSAKSAFLKPPKGWFNLLSRIASGRNYRGKLNKLIYDLFPQLVDKYNKASRKSTEREIFEQIIITELVNKASEDSDEWTRRRIYAAWKCLDHYFPENSESHEKDTTANISKQKNHPQETGKRCEKSCTSFLYEASLQEIYNNNESNENCCRSRRIILENVYVNTRRSSMYSTSSPICSAKPDAQHTPPPEIQAQKYKPPKPHRNGSGIIWTNYSESNGTSRHGICSEFDNVIIIEKNNMSGKSGNVNNSNEISLESIWEAKRTISPSTLHDVLTKKLRAVEALMDDRSTELAYMDNDNNMSSLLLFPNVEAANITFGVYGTELLPPENAADSIRSVATSNIISSDLNEVVTALERGGEVIMIEVDIERTLNIIRGLRKLVEEKIKSEERIQVLLLLERDVDFLCN